MLVFVTSILLADAIIGERGLLETLRARRRDAALQAEIAQQRQENARLREEARRLREDPRAIEAIARRDLGLLSPGEILFIIKDVSQIYSKVTSIFKLQHKFVNPFFVNTICRNCHIK